MKASIPAGVGVLAAALLCGPAAFVSSQDNRAGPPANEVRAVVKRGITFLANQQTPEGSFAPKLAGPGVSALVVAGLVRNGLSPKEPLVARTLTYLERQVQKDGGIYNKFLANYTTAVALMAFKEVNADGRYDAVIANGAKFLKRLQQGGDAEDLRAGGFGYDGKSRPDLSNTAFAVESLLAAGLPKDDPAVQKALRFISRCQNLPGEFNDQPFAKKASKEDKGGFVYNPLDADDKKHQTPAGGLRSQGAMTYNGLKSFLYVGVDRNDPRVKAAVGWMARHYTLDENPGMGKAGLYYYYHTFAKAMNALGDDHFVDAAGTKHDWRRELFEALRRRQEENGGWRNEGERTFGESNPELATAFALLSLSYCQKDR